MLKCFMKFFTFKMKSLPDAQALLLILHFPGMAFNYALCSIHHVGLNCLTSKFQILRVSDWILGVHFESAQVWIMVSKNSTSGFPNRLA